MQTDLADHKCSNQAITLKNGSTIDLLTVTPAVWKPAVTLVIYVGITDVVRVEA